MSETIGSRFKNAWNAFFSRDPTPIFDNSGNSSSYRPDRYRPTRGN